MSPQELLRSAFDKAVEAAQASCLIPHLNALPPIDGKTVFLVAGKAASEHTRMAQEWNT